MRCVVGLSNSVHLAIELARKLHGSFLKLSVKKFPDGELYVRFPQERLSGDVILVQSMYPNPNESLVEVVLAGHTARELGARRVVLVAPYLAYLRQDKRFKSGECVSNKIMAKILASFDEVIAVDPHLHRIRSLREIFGARGRHVSAVGVLAEFVKQHFSSCVIVGPDVESAQWAGVVARMVGCSFVILKKKRYSARVVRIKVSTKDSVRGKTVVLVDDMISTGHTLLEPIRQLKRLGAKRIVCMAVHGLFVEGALKKLRDAGAEVITANTIVNPVAKISVAGLLAEALK